MTILQFADRLTPVEVRLCARVNNVAITTKQISERSGLHPRTVAKISRMTTWATVPIDMADRFIRACGVSLANGKRHREFLKETKFDHVKRQVKKHPMAGRLSVELLTRHLPSSLSA